MSGTAHAAADWERGRRLESSPERTAERSSASPSPAAATALELSPDRSALESQALENRGAPDPDEEIRWLANGSGAGSGSKSGSAPAPAPVPKGPSATIALTGDTYTDSAAKSSKTVKYNVTWTGGAKEDYIIVQWVKGYFRDSGGKAKKAKMYDKITDVDFADWTIDSVDKDPAYWSDGSARWNYDVDGANAFSANDSPGPVKASDGKGAEAKLDFKTGVYKSAEVPTTTTGSITATPLTTLEPWEYHVLVDSSGKFTH